MTVNRLPYEMTFDSYADRTAWTYLNSSNAGTNTWVVAQQPDYAYVGRHMLYMTNDAGISRAYTTPSSGTMRCLALCSLQSLQADNYTLDFHYRGPKTSNDRLYVRVSTNQPGSIFTTVDRKHRMTVCTSAYRRTSLRVPIRIGFVTARRRSCLIAFGGRISNIPFPLTGNQPIISCSSLSARPAKVKPIPAGR